MRTGNSQRKAEVPQYTVFIITTIAIFIIGGVVVTVISVGDTAHDIIVVALDASTSIKVFVVVWS
jgi:hypothetical protein